MADNTSADRGLDDARQDLLRGKFGPLLEWKVPKITETIGPFEPDAFDPYRSRLEELISACTDRLKSHSDDEVKDIKEAVDQEITDAHGWQALLANEISSLRNRMPAWYIGGFGHPDHLADFSYWARMPHFSVAELTCLSVGINPQEFGREKLQELASSKDRHRFHDALAFIVKRYEQLQRAFGRGSLETKVYAKDFIAWVDQFVFEIHPEFIRPLKRFHSPPELSVEATAAKRPDKREIDTIAQLFTAMAIDHLGYVPGQARSPIPKEIAELAASMGLSVKDETVRKYLRIGQSFISSEWKPRRR